MKKVVEAIDDNRDVHFLSDLELASRLKGGSHAAFEELYSRFKGILHLHAYRKLGNLEEASDAVQELFALLWEKRESVPLSGNFSGYIYTIMVNRVHDMIARRQVASKYVLSLQQFMSGGQAITDHKIREKQLAAKIEAEINNLPEKMRAVFILSRKHNLSHKEIAEKLDISESTVKNHVKNALKILRVRLGIIVYLLFLLNWLDF
ncbi:MAG: RNA polymerase sigma-70 factor [Pseudosphingobacterium sp.]|nr:RNA polymerase sigma-70 factor [Pseudosphingobacterium sp.]